MTTDQPLDDLCFIWRKYQGTEPIQRDSSQGYRDSPRTGGGYIIDDETKGWVPNLDDAVKARLTTMLIDQRELGIALPKITKALVQEAKSKKPLPVAERAERLLRFIAKKTAIGAGYGTRPEDPAAYAWSESTSVSEIHYFIDYLVNKNWLAPSGEASLTTAGGYKIYSIVGVTVEGHSHIAEQATNVDSSQAFVAMWFDESTNEAYEEGIKPAIEKAGYKPLRIDQKPDVNKIHDEIIAEIRRSRFLVADFTQGAGGARGGVYFEAGFAHGLGLPVIYTCDKDTVKKLHFDTRQYAHIVWETPQDLCQRLQNRILARVGEGPLPR